MVKTASLFSQLLRHVPRTEFAALVGKHRAERYAKGFDSWTHFVAMLFAQVSGADSLRVICNGLSSCVGKMIHLGVGKAPNKSTLCYANQHRPHQLFEDLFWNSLSRFRQQGFLGAPGKKFRFKFKLQLLDSTTISLCLSLFPWAKFRRAKGGVKLHVLLDHADYMPDFLSISEASQHDVKFARVLQLNPGSFVVADKAYTDYALFAKWTDQGVFFVTRLKDNADYKVVRRLVPPQNRNIRRDQIIRFCGVAASRSCPYELRRVEFWDEENEKLLVFVTNNLELGASTIAKLYKERWMIEVFFKTLKQTLKIKTFIGTSENALRIQIWTAMLALLLFKWLHFISKARWSLSNLVSMLRLNLFTYRDLSDWINDPFQTPPLDPGEIQLALQLPGLGQLTPSNQTTSTQLVQKGPSNTRFIRGSAA
jgi:hypothetical protein